jgi:hypothetical protein
MCHGLSNDDDLLGFLFKIFVCIYLNPCTCFMRGPFYPSYMPSLAHTIQFTAY